MSELIFRGAESYGHLGDWLSREKFSSALLVSGNRSYGSVTVRLAPEIGRLSVSRISDFSPNPKKEEIVAILRDMDLRQHDVIIAVGGGTAMDIAKLLKFYGSDRGDSLARGVEPETHLDVPIVAIPTTSGSGSEATHFAVLYDGNLKMSIAHPSLQPSVVLLDSESLRELPHNIFAASLLDALCQAIESYWSIHSTEKSRSKALESMQILVRQLPGACNSRHPEELAELMSASHLAGQAINITKTTAPHAVSYPLTSGFGLMHGFAVASVLPEFFVYNSSVCEDDALDPRGKSFVEARLSDIFEVLGVSNAVEARSAFIRLVSSLGGVCSLSDVGVRLEDLDFLVQHGFNPDRVNNNPRRLTEQALRSILKRSLNRQV